MGAIFYREVSDGSKPYLTLAGEEFLRPLGIGSTWTSIRIVLQVALTPNGVSNITNVNAFFGLCYGAGGSYASSFCANAMGVQYANDTVQYLTNGGQNFLNGSLAYARKINNVITAPSGVTCSIGLPGRRSTIHFGIAKGSPNYTQGFCGVSSIAGGNFAIDQTNRHAIEWCDATSYAGPAITLNDTTTTLSGSTLGVAYTEATGPLDTLNLYWGKAQFPLEIYGIWISRLS